jgi:hypothetical protein
MYLLPNFQYNIPLHKEQEEVVDELIPNKTSARKPLTAKQTTMKQEDVKGARICVHNVKNMKWDNTFAVTHLIT